MVDFSRRATLPVAALAFATLLPAVARAADYLPPPPSLEAVDEERVTFGTGWYLRGDLTASQDVKLSIGGATVPRNSDFFNSWGAGLGFGYKYNDWFRSDVTADWNNPRNFQGNTVSGVLCQIGAVGTPSGGPFTGSLPVYSACSDYSRARLQAFNVLFNGYVDLGTWLGVTPYVGAGVGFTNIYQKFSRNWYMNNGNPYAPVWTDPFTQGTYQAYWDQTRSTNSFQFAWAAMAGFSYAVTRNASIDVGYRYLNLGKVTTYSLYGTSTQNLYSNQLRVGVRYTPD